MRGPGKDRPNTRFHGRIEGNGRLCEAAGCGAPGEFRAPGVESGPADQPRGYRWFCLDHVREFNARYNFFSGMTPEEINEAQHPLSGWERATRAFASAGGDVPPRWADFADPLDAIGGRFQRRVERERRDGRPLSEGDRKAMRVMGLETNADRATLRKRYAELLQRYHPDRNGGDRTHEHALREVIQAYQRLKKAPAFA